MSKYERMINNLTAREIATLTAIKTVEDLKEVVLHSQWNDDHCPCVGVKINGVPVAFWWLTNEAAGAFSYTDSKKAMTVVLDIVREGINEYEAEVNA